MMTRSIVYFFVLYFSTLAFRWAQAVQPKDLFLKPGTSVHIKSPKRLNAREISSEVDLLIYAVGHAWSASWLKPLEVTRAIQGLAAVKASGSLDVVTYCGLISRALETVPDQHTYVKTDLGRCGNSQTRTEKALSIGSNLSAGKEKPWLLEWRSFPSVPEKKILVFAAKSFPQFDQAVWQGFVRDFPTFLSQSNGLVIDLRGHSGGDNDPGFYVASQLWGKRAPESRDRFQVQTPEALALFANRIDFNLRQKETRLAGFESMKSTRNGLMRDYRDAVSGKLALVSHIDKERYLDPETKELIPDPQKGYQHPIVVIMDRDAGSAAEEFIGVLVKHPRVTLVGQPSSGTTHFGNQGFLLLPYSKIQVWLSTWFALNRDGKFIELVGFQPSVAVPFETDAFHFVETKWTEITHTK